MPRIAITGLGAITPLGLDVEATWQQAMAGESGIERVSVPEHVPVCIAGRIKGFKDHFLSVREAKRYDPFVRYAVEAAGQAIQDADLADAWDVQRVAVTVGSGIGGLFSISENTLKLQNPGARVHPFFIPGTIINMTAGCIATRWQLKGPSFSPVSACATGAHSLVSAAMLIDQGLADVVICGGSEYGSTDLGLAGFAAMRALSTRVDEPRLASRPWDKDRDGFVMADGAGVLVLESERHARSRQADIKGWLVGYGMSTDGFHITQPDPDGLGVERAMSAALESAGLSIGDIGYVNAHATSTPLGDMMEPTVLTRMLAGQQHHLLMSASKSMMGHLLGAAGSVEAILTLKALQMQCVPPTINLDNPSEDFAIDLVAHHARPHTMRYALSNSFGFGGTNVCLAFATP